MSDSSVIEASTKADFDKILADSKDTGKLVVVDFTATWCGPCQMIKPEFVKFSNEYKDVVFVKVDVDKNEETAAACGIRCMPTFKFYKNGEQIDEMQGADVKGLEQKIKEKK